MLIFIASNSLLNINLSKFYLAKIIIFRVPNIALESVKFLIILNKQRCLFKNWRLEC